MSAAGPSMELASFLEPLVHKYNSREFLSTDPLSVVHRYSERRDREIAGLVASSLSYGRVETIVRSALDALERMGPSPYAFVREFDAARHGAAFDGWFHRFNRGEDLSALAHGLRQVYEGWGSIEAFFVDGYRKEDTADSGEALQSFVDRFLSLDYAAVSEARFSSQRPGMRWFFPSPRGGSACKRLHLYLRWMVRRDELDLGVWSSVDPAHLMMPVDTHVARIAAYLGLSKRSTVGWAMVEDITAGLRTLHPTDPIRYDWAISRLGILDHCPTRRDLKTCGACPLVSVCRA